jgi:hypothetical protein
MKTLRLQRYAGRSESRIQCVVADKPGWRRDDSTFRHEPNGVTIVRVGLSRLRGLLEPDFSEAIVADLLL